MNNKEFLYSSGENIEPEIIERIHRDFKRQEVDDRERDNRLESILNRINFSILEMILKDYFVKSGVEGPMNFIGLDRIRHDVYNKNDDATHMVLENLIALSYDNMDKADGDIDLDLLHVLCHEEVHAISRLEQVLKIESEGNHMSVSVKAVKSGFKQNSLFVALNEGVVEKLAQEVLKKYLVADPSYVSDERKTLFNDRLENQPDSVTFYVKEVQLVDILVKKIAKEVGISENTVYQGFIRGLMAGEDFNDEIKSDFDEMFPKGFLDKLATQKVGGNYEELMDLIEAGRLKRWFSKFINLV